MKVILLQDIEKLGKIGEIKNVTPGYARNFLFPRKMAQLATRDNLKEVDKIKLAQEMKAKIDLEAVEKIVGSLDGYELTLPAKVKEEGKLYGSISDSVIAKELKNQGFEVNKSQIKLPEPIKEVGDYEVVVAFDHGLEANIKVSVVGE